MSLNYYAGLFPTSPAGTVPKTRQLVAELLVAGITAECVWDTDAQQVAVATATDPSGDLTTIATAVAAHVPAASSIGNPVATLATTNATTQTLFSVTLVNNSSYMIEATVIARRTGGSSGTAGDSLIWRRVGGFKRTGGGGAALISIGDLSEFGFVDTFMSATFTLDTSGNDVRGRVTGDTNVNYTWDLKELKIFSLTP